MSPLIGVKTSLKLAWITVSENTENVAFFKYCNIYKYSSRSANHPQIKCLILFSNPQDTSGARMTWTIDGAGKRYGGEKPPRSRLGRGWCSSG